MTTKRLSSNDEDVHQRLVAVRARLQKTLVAETRIKKLNIALGSIAVSERPKQLALIRAAHRHIESIAEDGVQGLKASLSMIANELNSLSDGIRSGEATKEDLVLLSGVSALEVIQGLRTKATNVIGRLEVQITANEVDQNQVMILKNKKYKESMPSLTGSDKEFAIARAPVAFTFEGKNSHSSIGFVNPAALDLMGFKVENLAGYTILHKQLVIGINSAARHSPVLDDDGAPAVDDNGFLLRKPRMVKETHVVFKGGKPTKVVKRREMTLKDIAEKVLKQLSAKTKVPYTMVSDRPVGHNGAGWFWVIPTVDMQRLAKAFPGNHVGLNKWGFAF